MNRTTINRLAGCARLLRDHHPTGAPNADYVTFGLATEYLRAFVDNEWTNQMVFGEHPTVARSSRAGRTFMRADGTAADEHYRNQQRTLRIAELLFNLQDVEGIDARLEQLRSGNVESTYAELEAGAFLLQRAMQFRYVNPSGIKGADYDAEIQLTDGIKVNCEMKCKAEGTDLGEGAVRNPLQAARNQLAPDEPGLLFLKVPEAWVCQPESIQVVPTAIDTFLRGTSRVVAVVLRWEEQQAPPGCGRWRVGPLQIPPRARRATEASTSTYRGDAHYSGWPDHVCLGVVSRDRGRGTLQVITTWSNEGH